MSYLGGLAGDRLKMKKCTKCAGSGNLPEYQHIMRGECIPCRGTGEVEDRPEREIKTSRKAEKKGLDVAARLERIREWLNELDSIRGRGEWAIEKRHNLSVFIGYAFGEIALESERDFALRVESRLKARMRDADFRQAMDTAGSFGWESNT